MVSRSGFHKGVCRGFLYKVLHTYTPHHSEYYSLCSQVLAVAQHPRTSSGVPPPPPPSYTALQISGACCCYNMWGILCEKIIGRCRDSRYIEEHCMLKWKNKMQTTASFNDIQNHNMVDPECFDHTIYLSM